MAKRNNTKPIDQCVKTVARCLHLTQVYIDSVKSHESGQPYSKDLVRSAAVLAVAAMDAYFTAKFTDILVPYLKRRGPTPDLVAFLSQAGLDTEEALLMLTMQRPYRRVRTLVQLHLEKYTSQRFEVIDQLFAAYGLPELSKQAEAKAKRKTLRRSIKILVERRHQIVHNGDYNKHGRLRDINEMSVLTRINDLLIFVGCADFIIDNLVMKK